MKTRKGTLIIPLHLKDKSKKSQLHFEKSVLMLFYVKLLNLELRQIDIKHLHNEVDLNVPNINIQDGVFHCWLVLC